MNKFICTVSRQIIRILIHQNIYSMFRSTNRFNDGSTKLTKVLSLFLVFVIAWPSCHFSEHQNGKLKFNPLRNKVYHFSLTKYSEKSWTYQSLPIKIPDTVYLNFSLQATRNRDTSVTCTLKCNRFVWKGKFKVNYIRDSSHALSTTVVLSDSGKVAYVEDMSNVLLDIENDSATGKYLSGVISDQLSHDAVTDMLNRICSVIPTRQVKPGDSWIRDITLITNHPVEVSNFKLLKAINGDTATIEIQSHFFARLSSGYDPYIQGNLKGNALISYATGIPYWYKTQSETITKTNFYDMKEIATWIFKLE